MSMRPFSFFSLGYRNESIATRYKEHICKLIDYLVLY